MNGWLLVTVMNVGCEEGNSVKPISAYAANARYTDDPWSPTRWSARYPPLLVVGFRPIAGHGPADDVFLTASRIESTLRIQAQNFRRVLWGVVGLMALKPA
jgi:hypothetical protein